MKMHVFFTVVGVFSLAVYAAHARSVESVVRDQNAVHPSAAGGGQIGDVIAAWIRCRWEFFKL